MKPRAVVEAPTSRQLPMVLEPCPSDSVATVRPLVIGDASGPYWWATHHGCGWTATAGEAWERVTATKNGAA